MRETDITSDTVVCVDTCSSICPSLFCESDWCDLLHHHCPVGDGSMYPSEWTHHWLLSEIWSDGEWELSD